METSGQRDEAIAVLRAAVWDKTLLQDERLHVMQHLVEDLPPTGSLAELGVYKGGTSFFLASLVPDRLFFAFDTFCGLPNSYQPYETDLMDLEDKMQSPGGTAEWLSSLPNMRLCAGVFPCSSHYADKEGFALVHLDGDLYKTTVDGLRFFWPRIVPGGFLVVDDFHRPECLGVDKALSEYFYEAPWQDWIYSRLPHLFHLVLRKPCT